MITEEMFIAAIGSAPENDDLERSNCPDAGKIGHSSCGWCLVHNRPRYMGDCEYSKTPELHKNCL